jgi:hypothetical protein
MEMDAAVWEAFEAHALKWPNDPGVEITIRYFNWWTTAVREALAAVETVDAPASAPEVAPAVATEALFADDMMLPAAT